MVDAISKFLLIRSYDNKNRQMSPETFKGGRSKRKDNRDSSKPKSEPSSRRVHKLASVSAFEIVKADDSEVIRASPLETGTELEMRCFLRENGTLFAVVAMAHLSKIHDEELLASFASGISESLPEIAEQAGGTFDPQARPLLCFLASPLRANLAIKLGELGMSPIDPSRRGNECFRDPQSLEEYFAAQVVAGLPPPEDLVVKAMEKDELRIFNSLPAGITREIADDFFAKLGKGGNSR